MDDIKTGIIKAIANQFTRKGNESYVDGETVVVLDMRKEIQGQKPKYIKNSQHLLKPNKIKSPNIYKGRSEMNKDEIIKAIKKWAKANGFEVEIE